MEEHSALDGDAGRRRDRAHSRSDIVRALVIGVVASAAGIALGLAIDWWPDAGSKEAGAIDTFYDVLIICSVPVFVGVSVVVGFTMVRYRMRPGEEDLDGPPVHGSTKLEVIWTIIPAVALVALCSYAYVTLRDIEDAEAGSMKVRVVGEQFTWTFHYPMPGGGEVSTNQLYLPEGQQANFRVQSKDVIHDFWVPAFRMKIDAVPGVTTSLRATPNGVGGQPERVKVGDREVMGRRYPVVCAELCGLGHAAMRQAAIVLPPQDFRDWLAEERKRKEQPAGTAAGGDQGSEAPGGGGADAGKQVFASNGCGSCHVLADAQATGQVGPNLDEVLDGQTAEQVKESIVKPQAATTKGYPANVMPPNYGETIAPGDIDALVQYLTEVSK